LISPSTGAQLDLRPWCARFPAACNQIARSGPFLTVKIGLTPADH